MTNPSRRRFLAGTIAAVSLAGTGLAIDGAPLGAAETAKAHFTVDLVNEPASLDPQKQWNPDSYYVYRNIFDNLVTRDDAGKIVPQVASAWRQISPTEMEFTIRGDIAFHDGSRLTPADVAFSVNRIIDPKFASPQLGQFNKITGARVAGTDKVVVTTRGPYPVLLAQLVKLSIVPEKAVRRMGDAAFNLNPVGSGPYVFDKWTRGVSVGLRRNARYWGVKGPFDAVTFRAVPDAATRLADLQAGTADLVVSLNSDQAAQLGGGGGVKALSAPTERVAFLGMNTTRAPLDNPDLRRAIAYGIDREGLVQGILGGHGRVLGEMLTPAHFGWTEGIAPYPYDPDKARKLVAAAGAAARTEMEFATAPVFDQRIVQALQQMMAEIGLKVKIRMFDMASYLKAAQGPIDRRPMLNFGRWSCACQDADGVLYPLLDSGSNWSRYRNAEVDRLLTAARNTLDNASRLDDYARVNRIVKAEVPLLPLYQAFAIYGASDKLQWQPTANESLFLNRMRWGG